jgi:endoglucanase
MTPIHRRHRRTLVAAAAAAVALAGLVAPNTATACTTRFYTPPADPGARQQIADLRSAGHAADARLVRREVTTPQAVWFTSGTPKEVRRGVHAVAVAARKQRAVPTLVAYDVPGRDCSQYSSGGAGSDAAYRAWIDGFAAGLPRHRRVAVVVEPDGLANLPSDCPAAYPGQDVAALTAGRIADIRYAGRAIRRADRDALVYLDAGHSGWHAVGDMARRLHQAGVARVQGFSLNVSNYQPTPQLLQYGTWVSKCLYYARADGAHPGAYGDCASQYYPASPTDYSTWSKTDAWYATNVDTAANPPRSADLAHFVLDTSRNGRGPWTPTASYPDPQVWCNPPGRGLGLRPSTRTGNRLADAYLWIKTPGQSDGQCNRGVAGSTTDPAWGGITDPAAGAWFPAQALELAKLAEPPLRRPAL